MLFGSDARRMMAVDAAHAAAHGGKTVAMLYQSCLLVPDKQGIILYKNNGMSWNVACEECFKMVT
jgi:hypothetical protein